MQRVLLMSYRDHMSTRLNRQYKSHGRILRFTYQHPLQDSVQLAGPVASAVA